MREPRAEDCRRGDEDGVSIVGQVGKDFVLVGNLVDAPFRADSRPFDRMPEIWIREKLVCFLSRCELAEFESEFVGKGAIRSIGNERDPMPPRAKGDADADVGIDVAAGSEGTEDDVKLAGARRGFSRRRRVNGSYRVGAAQCLPMLSNRGAFGACDDRAPTPAAG